jgi:BASS family bile acid:Na+ symporter
MTAVALTNALLVVLAIVMAGLGLSLTVEDFRRLREHPLAAVLALALQVLVLPLMCVGVIAAFDLPPLYAVGLMLLAASPGGITANLFSHLFGGHVAVNLSLTALNTVLSLVTLPLIANWAIAHYAGGGQVVPLPWQKLAEVIGVIAVPVLLGMAARRARPDIAARLDKPVKLLSAVLLC